MSSHNELSWVRDNELNCSHNELSQWAMLSQWEVSRWEMSHVKLSQWKIELSQWEMSSHNELSQWQKSLSVTTRAPMLRTVWHFYVWHFSLWELSLWELDGIARCESLLWEQFNSVSRTHESSLWELIVRADCESSLLSVRALYVLYIIVHLETSHCESFKKTFLIVRAHCESSLWEQFNSVTNSWELIVTAIQFSVTNWWELIVRAHCESAFHIVRAHSESYY